MRTQIEISGPTTNVGLMHLEEMLEEWLGSDGEIVEVAEDSEDWTLQLSIEFDRQQSVFAQEILAVLRAANAPAGTEVTIYEPHSYRLDQP